MVQPIKNLKAFAYPLGGEIQLTWTMPSEVPDNYRIGIFKSKAEISNTVIRDNINSERANPIGIEYAAYFDDTQIYVDMECINDITYYYKLVIIDEDTKEYSEAAEVSCKANTTAKFTVFDALDVVTKGIKKLISNYEITYKEGEKEVKEQLKVYKEFSIPNQKNVNNWIVVHRVANETAQRFLGNKIAGFNDAVNMGVIKTDTIQATIFSRNDRTRLNNIYMFLESQEFALRRHCLHKNAIEALFANLGDRVDGRSDGDELLWTAKLCSIMYENKVEMPLPTAPYSHAIKIKLVEGV